MPVDRPLTARRAGAAVEPAAAAAAEAAAAAGPRGSGFSARLAAPCRWRPPRNPCRLFGLGPAGVYPSGTSPPRYPHSVPHSLDSPIYCSPKWCALSIALGSVVRATRAWGGRCVLDCTFARFLSQKGSRTQPWFSRGSVKVPVPEGVTDAAMVQSSSEHRATGLGGVARRRGSGGGVRLQWQACGSWWRCTSAHRRTSWGPPPPSYF